MKQSICTDCDWFVGFEAVCSSLMLFVIISWKYNDRILEDPIQILTQTSRYTINHTSTKINTSEDYQINHTWWYIYIYTIVDPVIWINHTHIIYIYVYPVFSFQISSISIYPVYQYIHIYICKYLVFSFSYPLVN